MFSYLYKLNISLNDEVNALAEEALNKSSIGMDDITDLLALTYYAGNYAHKSVQECAMEIQDTYVRLDRSIADLLSHSRAWRTKAYYMEEPDK